MATWAEQVFKAYLIPLADLILTTALVTVGCEDQPQGQHHKNEAGQVHLQLVQAGVHAGQLHDEGHLVEEMVDAVVPTQR